MTTSINQEFNLLACIRILCINICTLFIYVQCTCLKHVALYYLLLRKKSTVGNGRSLFPLTQQHDQHRAVRLQVIHLRTLHPHQEATMLKHVFFQLLYNQLASMVRRQLLERQACLLNYDQKEKKLSAFR